MEADYKTFSYPKKIGCSTVRQWPSLRPFLSTAPLFSTLSHSFFPPESNFPQALSAVNSRKKVFSILRGSFSDGGITDFVRELVGQKGVIIPLKKESLPSIATIEPWDGQDGQVQGIRGIVESGSAPLLIHVITHTDTLSHTPHHTYSYTIVHTILRIASHTYHHLHTLSQA